MGTFVPTLKRLNPTRILLITGVAFLVSLMAMRMSPKQLQDSLPPNASPEFIERHFDLQIEELKRLVSTGAPTESANRELFESPAIRGAQIYTEIKERSHRAIAVKDFRDVPGAGPAGPPERLTEGTFVGSWKDGTIHYEQRFHVDGNLKGIELILDRIALQSLK